MAHNTGGNGDRDFTPGAIRRDMGRNASMIIKTNLKPTQWISEPPIEPMRYGKRHLGRMGGSVVLAVAAIILVASLVSVL